MKADHIFLAGLAVGAVLAGFALESRLAARRARAAELRAHADAVAAELELLSRLQSLRASNLLAAA